MNTTHNRSARRLMAVASVTLAIAACGGGGGGGDSDSDSTAPTATVAVDRSAGLSGEVVVVTITASEALSGLSASDMAVVNGTVESIQTDHALVHQVIIRLGDAGTTCTITLPPRVCTDQAGNPLVVTWTGAVDIAAVDQGWASATGTSSGRLWADLTVSDQTLRFIWIAPGTFRQGSPSSESGRYRDESQHTVTLTRGFWMSESEVPNAFWRAGAPGYPAGVTIPADQMPLSGLSVADIDGFLPLLAAAVPSHPTIRLPSEAEWEYAARAGTITPLSCPSPLTLAQVNGLPSVDDVYLPLTGSSSRDCKVPVKSLPANPWGLYEMHGNVWEVCGDWYVPDYPAGPVVDPLGAEAGSPGRNVRGGGYNSFGVTIRSANRIAAPDLTGRDFEKIGLRLVIAGDSYVPAGDG